MQTYIAYVQNSVAINDNNGQPGPAHNYTDIPGLSLTVTVAGRYLAVLSFVNSTNKGGDIAVILTDGNNVNICPSVAGTEWGSTINTDGRDQIFMTCVVDLTQNEVVKARVTWAGDIGNYSIGDRQLVLLGPSGTGIVNSQTFTPATLTFSGSMIRLWNYFSPLRVAVSYVFILIKRGPTNRGNPEAQ